MTTGLCVAESNLLYVSPTGTLAADCSQASPCNFTKAVSSIDSATNVIKVGVGTYAEDVSITGPKNVSIRGSNASIRSLRLTDVVKINVRDLNMDEVVCSLNSTSLPATAIELEHTTVRRINASVCNVLVRDSKINTPAIVIVTGDETAITNHAKVLIVERSFLSGGGGFLADDITVTNSVIADLDPSGNLYHSAFVGPAITVSFATFYNAPLSCGQGHRYSNDIHMMSTPPPNGFGAPVYADTGCDFKFSILTPQNTPPPGSNNIFNMDPMFADVSNRDFHLMQGSPAIDTADPSASLSADFDGTLRPQGVVGDIGAFEYKP